MVLGLAPPLRLFGGAAESSRWRSTTLFTNITQLQVSTSGISNFQPWTTRSTNKTRTSSDHGPKRHLSSGECLGGTESGGEVHHTIYIYQAGKRGSLSELHDAKGFADGSFSYTVLIQGYPFSYGQFIATQLVAAALRINLGVPSIRYDDARAQPELAEVFQRWTRECYGASSMGALELGSPPTQIVGMAEPDDVSLIQKAYRARRFIDAARRLQKFFQGRRADDAARRLQKFFRRKIAIPRTPERRTHRRTHARVVPDHDLKIAASNA
eukprot:6036561-Pleurochrysis_carterae.AAC.1